MKHEIGDALYELYDGDWDGNRSPDRVLVWPVAKVTERFVYIYDHRDYEFGDSRKYRLDRATLERDGKCYHRAALSALYVRPQVDWPMMVVAIDGPRAIGAGR